MFFSGAGFRPPAIGAWGPTSHPFLFWLGGGDSVPLLKETTGKSRVPTCSDLSTGGPRQATDKGAGFHLLQICLFFSPLLVFEGKRFHYWTEAPGGETCFFGALVLYMSDR